jgi:hypothetical protein
MSLSTTRNTRIALSLAIVAVFGSASFAAAAQAYTPQEFVRACESSIGNTVYLSQSLKLQGGFTSETYVSASGCTIVLSPDAAFELDQITLNFGGPLAVRGSKKGAVKLEKAMINAASVALNLTGEEGELYLNQSRIFAGAGNLTVQFGQKGKLNMVESGGWTRGGLSTLGALRIGSGAYFQGSLSNSGMEGGTGIFLAANGTESSWKIEKSTLNVSNFNYSTVDDSAMTYGPLSITSSAPKVNVEISESNIRFASQAVTMHLAGAESTLLLKQATSQTGSQAIYLGAPGDKGIVLVEKSFFIGNPSVVVVSGNNGATGVIGSPGSLSAQNSIRVTSGVGGSCIVTPQNSLLAPQVSACR